MEHNVCLSSFRSRGTFVAVLFWSTPECFAFTIIVPRLQRHRYWWAILQAMAVDSFLLGRKGDPAVLLFSSRTCPEFITRLSRLRILQELLFSRERYRWNITSVFPPFVLVGPLLRYFFDQRQSVSLLPSLSLVYNGIVIGEQYSKLWQ